MTERISLPSAAQAVNMSEDDVLKFTRALRVQAITDLHKNGSLASENSDRNLFVSLVNGLDSQAISVKRIDAEQKSSQGNAALIAEIVAKITPASFQVPAGTVVDVPSRELPAEFSEVTAVPGETDVNPPQLDFDSFTRDNAPQIPGVVGGIDTTAQPSNSITTGFSNS